MPTDKPRMIVTVDEDLFNQIEDWRIRNRYPTRSMAIVEILKAGMAQIGDRDDPTIKRATRQRKKQTE